VRRRRPVPLRRVPRVSVVVPCYNYGRFLPQSVGSALAQDGVEVDVLIVDDASSDDSADVARALSAQDPRVSMTVHEHNRGHITTYNEGLAAVDGDYVLLLSADDVLAPGALARAAAVMDAYPRVGLVYGWSPSFSDQVPPARTRLPLWSVWSGQEWLASVFRRAKNPVYTPSAVMRRSALDRLGGYDQRLKHAADLFMWMLTASRWDIAHVDGTDQAFYRKHGENMHVAEYDGWVTDLRLRLETLEVFVSEHCDELADAAALLERARRALAADALRMVSARLSSGAVDQAEVEELLDFARTTWPPAAAGARFRRLASPAARRGARAVAMGHVLRDRLVWRYWRRFGVYP